MAPKKPVVKKATAKKPVAKKSTSRKSSGMFDPKQPGYKAPGSSLKGKTAYTGFGYDQGVKGSKKVPSMGITTLLFATDDTFKKFHKNNSTYKLPTGINPRAMKVTRGNPKPTSADMAKGKAAKKTTSRKKSK